MFRTGGSISDRRRGFGTAGQCFGSAGGAAAKFTGPVAGLFPSGQTHKTGAGGFPRDFPPRLLAGGDGRELWEPAQELALYPSKEAVARAVELVPLSELLPKDWKGAEER